MAYKFTQNFEKIRQNYSKLDYIQYNYPVRLERDASIPKYLKARLDASNNKLFIEFRLSSSKIFRIMIVNCLDTIQEVIVKCLKVVGKFDEEKTGGINKDYVMKVNGHEEYLGLLEDYPLIQYTVRLFSKQIYTNFVNFLINSILISLYANHYLTQKHHRLS